MDMWRKKIEAAFARAMEDNHEIYERQLKVRKRFQEAGTVCFFGTGEFYHDCYGHPGFAYEYCCDNDPAKWGKTYRGKRCIPPEELKSMEDPVVLVMVGEYRPIQKQLDEMGIENYNCDDIFLNVFDQKYDRAWFEGQKSRALDALELLADDASRQVYVTALLNRMAPQLSDRIFNDIKIPGEYYGSGVFSLGEKEVLVDAGAFDGDSALGFIRAVHGSFDKIYAFEIDGNNFRKLQDRLTDWKDRLVLFQKGVWKESGILKFGGENYGSSVKEDGSNTAEMISIDEAVNGERVTLIKMDVEGSELPALEGARNTIRTWRPKLAVSAYHYLNDLWDVPLKIRELCPDYQIYLRHHAPTVWDTDCYAVIKGEE